MKHTYLIGDVQGCFDGLISLLDIISPSNEDTLIFLGDIINRGDKSLQVLDFIMHNHHQMILGNHDFHLLACHFGVCKPSKKDTFIDILYAPNVKKYIDYLLQTPVVKYQDQSYMVHAGIPSVLSHQAVISLSTDIHNELIHTPEKFIASMYQVGTQTYHSDLDYYDRLRYAVNAFMRMRYVLAGDTLDFDYKGDTTLAPAGLKPWFMDNMHLTHKHIYFGHWSTLTNPHIAHLYPLDGGYIWGGTLKALRLADKKIFHITRYSD